eukprot:27061-Eustigmatos_ZCMA.PRE.1
MYLCDGWILGTPTGTHQNLSLTFSPSRKQPSGDANTDTQGPGGEPNAEQPSSDMATPLRTPRSR